MAQEQIQLEFSKELMQMPMLQQQAQMNPQIQLQLQQMMQMIESRKAKLIAQMTKDYMNEETKINLGATDPLVQLKSREIDLRAMENERKRRKVKID